MPSSAVNIRRQRPILTRRRNELLQTVHDFLAIPTIILSFIWIGLTIVSMVSTLDHMLSMLLTAIWIIFGIHFLIEFLIAPDKLKYVKSNWITLVALVLPGAGILRTLPLIGPLFVSGSASYVNLLRVITGANRGMRAAMRILGRRGLGFVLALTAIVLFLGAAGMYSFESTSALHQLGISGPGFKNYADALWWSAMEMDTVGSAYSPQTNQGRLLCWFLSLFGVTIFGYITASVASLFVAQDKKLSAPDKDALKGSKGDATDLHADEIHELRVSIAGLTAKINALITAGADPKQSTQ